VAIQVSKAPICGISTHWPLTTSYNPSPFAGDGPNRSGGREVTCVMKKLLDTMRKARDDPVYCPRRECRKRSALARLHAYHTGVRREKGCDLLAGRLPRSAEPMREPRDRPGHARPA